MIRRWPCLAACALALFFASSSQAWVESVEFPWNSLPRSLWERELVWLKNIGIMHVSIPEAGNTTELGDLIRILRRLDLEADLEGKVPDELLPLTRAHGGPLTEPLPGPVARISALSGASMARARELALAGAPSVLWTDAEDTLGPSGYRAGAVSFAGEERSAAAVLRRNAQLSLYWGRTLETLRESPGAGFRPEHGTQPRTEGIGVRQFVAPNGISLIALANRSASAWSGDLKALYPLSGVSPRSATNVAGRVIALPGVTVGARDVVWLPVNLPLSAGPLCKDCTAFSSADHLVYATSELTGMEYENGILAMEFTAPAPGEVILQLSREPSGPLVAGGKPSAFDWDERTQLARLRIPKGSGPGNRVRIGLAIGAPDSTAFFDSARVLLIGETNRLTAQFSSPAIAGRSRLRATPAWPVGQVPSSAPFGISYAIRVPETAVQGDHAELAIEADGAQLSHARPELVSAAALHFREGVGVRFASDAVLELIPATIPVNQRAGREIALTVRNNAPEIRTFHLEMTADGIEFSPAKIDLSVGASASREVTFRVFARDASPGLHSGQAILSGANLAGVFKAPVQFVVIPTAGAVAFQAAGFSIIESARLRAVFLPGRWLEWLDKDTGQNALPGAGIPFIPGAIEINGGGLVFEGGKTLRLENLQALAPRSK